MYNQIREGCRGGWSNFKWESVRQMTYKDRECYLGATYKLGFLDKGGRWRKKNWWTNNKTVLNNHKANPEPEKEEIKEVQHKEKDIMSKKLFSLFRGLLKSKPDSHIKNEIRQEELNEISKRTVINEENLDHFQKASNFKGVGYDMNMNSKKMKNITQEELSKMNKLEGIGLEFQKDSLKSKSKTSHHYSDHHKHHKKHRKSRSRSRSRGSNKSNSEND